MKNDFDGDMFDEEPKVENEDDEKSEEKEESGDDEMENVDDMFDNELWDENNDIDD